MEKMEKGSEVEDSGEPIVCPLSPWFFRRMGMLILLVAGLALYFLYDGAIGYPKKNFTADLFDAYEAGRSGLDWEAAGIAGKSYSEEQVTELKKAGQAGADGATWAGFAAERLLPEKAPERFTAAEIQEQFHFAILLGVIAGSVLIWCFLQRKKAFRCQQGDIITPQGGPIPFSSVIRLDLKKWDRGIARLTCADAEDGTETVVKVDDYKYAGTDRILRRLCESNEELEIVGDRRWLFGEDES